MLTYIIPGFLSFRTFAALETEASICFYTEYTESMTDSRVGSSNAQTHIYTCKLGQDRLYSCPGFWGQLSLC